MKKKILIKLIFLKEIIVNHCYYEMVSIRINNNNFLNKNYLINL